MPIDADLKQFKTAPRRSIIQLVLVRLKMLSDTDVACVAIALIICKKREKKKRRWMKKCYMRRQQYTHEKLLDELRFCEANNDANVLPLLDSLAFDTLLTLIEPKIRKNDTCMREAIPPSQRLSITLRYLFTGNSFEDLKLVSAISPQSIGIIVIETCQALIEGLKDFIKIPRTPEEWKEIAKGFQEQWNFPHCIGAIDGKHVAIKKPPNSGSLFYNYKKFCSIVQLAVVNSNYEFIMVDVGMNGRVSNEEILNNSKFGQLLTSDGLHIPPNEVLPNSNKTAPFVFVGNDAFAMSHNLLKPYSQTELTLNQRILNYRLNRAHRIVENAFGILHSKFGIFQTSISLSPEKASVVVLACCYLHNFLRKRKLVSYGTLEQINRENLKTGSLILGSWRERGELVNIQASHSRNPSERSKEIRDTFCDYFNNEGKIAWQDKFC